MLDAPEGTRLSLSRSYGGTTDTLNRARVDLNELLQANDLAALIADAELVLSELASNAIEASPDQPYHVSIHITDADVTVRVTNRSEATIADDAEQGPAEVLAPQGRGLMIVHALAESVNITRSGPEITVTANMALPAA